MQSPHRHWTISRDGLEVGKYRAAAGLRTRGALALVFTPLLFRIFFLSFPWRTESGEGSNESSLSSSDSGVGAEGEVGTEVGGVEPVESDPSESKSSS